MGRVVDVRYAKELFLINGYWKLFRRNEEVLGSTAYYTG